MARQSGHHRHAQGLGYASHNDGDEEDPDDSPAMKDRRRRRRAAIFEVLPVLQDLDNIHRKISRERRVRLVILLLVTAFLFVSFRFYSGSGGGGHEAKVVKVAKGSSNLNRMDMPMRTVGGVRQACLQLLPETELEQLKLPPVKDSVVKEIQYLDGGRNFAGDQSQAERMATFRVQDTMQVHCGWCSGNGFDIDAFDTAFMKTCSVVVITCTFGGGDNLYQPIGFVNASLSKVCYVAFWDEVTMQTQEEAGNRLDADRKIGLWRVVLVRNLPFADQRKNGKIPKMLGHRLFPNARFSIWTDSKSQFRRDPMGVLEALLWKPESDFAISEHGARSCVYKEAVAIVQKHKALPEEVAIQLDAYRLEGMPENLRIGGRKALAEASVIVREHTPATNLFMCVWFNEVMRFTARDQLSFPYVLHRLPILNLNMFPVCTRKSLVNSIGHARKAAPLVVDS
ncbi:hypothetical protein KC19_2G030500 [Ceratodon purpureus]|uniref:TOD1/MUCI70 glycosyltransferase-like domain-containing protein n=1 Tax=Ceratodon purpureus TaxID=3225 RepID=A0A8T0ISD7_CERPU|nr:hypothetical protein KC19_2G030500 [Ceratodon purpureus]